MRSDVENAFEPLQQKLRFWHPVGNIAAVIGPLAIIIHLVRFVLPHLIGGQTASERNDAILERDIGGIIEMAWPFFIFIPCFFLRQFIVPRMVQSMQPEAYATLERKLNNISNAHAGWTFLLERVPHNVRTKHGERLAYMEVKITFTQTPPIAAVPVMAQLVGVVQPEAMPVEGNAV